MKPIKFPQQTVVWAENQPEYFPLPAYSDDQETITCWHLPAYSDDQETITCWHLSILERLYLLFTGKLWLRQMNFGGPLQPQSLSVETPFDARPTSSFTNCDSL